MPTLYGSPMRITWSPDLNPVVLVDFLDDLETLVEINGQKSIQTAMLVRGAGQQVFDRRNRSTVLRFAKRVVCGSLQQALAYSVTELTQIPQGTADVLLQVQGSPMAYRILNAVISSWDGGIRAEGELLAIIGRTITGGQIVIDS